MPRNVAARAGTSRPKRNDENELQMREEGSAARLPFDHWPAAPGGKVAMPHEGS
ncbi:hypothetical protein [Rhodopila sp.]|uniref:hypothetical protein n=1 Tax=Rhodopila sp. TaxID=2480087 RepID=UPI002D80C6B3|nr:hypothetical protein [Rhodopila sp.]